MITASKKNRWTLKRRKALCEYILKDPTKGVKEALGTGIGGDEIIKMVENYKIKGVDGIRISKKTRKNKVISGEKLW